VDFEFDSAKDSINRGKHGVPLALGRMVIENTVGDVLDPRPYGEVRRIAFGLVEGRLFVAVYTMRRGVCRLISVRKANSRERRRWLPSSK